MSAKSRGCAVLRYLVLQQLVLVTDVLGQSWGLAPPPAPRPGHPRIANAPPPYQKQLNPYHTPPPYPRYRGGDSPFNHKNSHSPSSPNLPEFYNHKTNKYRQPPPPPPPQNRRPSPSSSMNYRKPPLRGGDKYAPPYQLTNRPEQLHEYQQNYYKLQQSQKQFFNQPIKQQYQQQQHQLAYHKEQLRLEEQHAQNSQKVFSRVKAPDSLTQQKPAGYIVTPHPENYDPFTSISTSEYTLNFDRNPFKIGSAEADVHAIHGYRGPQTMTFQDETKTEKYVDSDNQTVSYDQETQSSSYTNRSEETQRPYQTAAPTLNQLRVFNKLKSTTVTFKPGNRTISTNISLLSNNIDSKHKHLIKFVRSQNGGFKSREGTSIERADTGSTIRRSDLNYFPDRPGTTTYTHGFPSDNFTRYGPANIYSVPSSSNTRTTPRFPIRRAHGQPFSFAGHNTPNTNTVGFHDKRIVRGPVNNVTHLIGLSLNDTNAPSAEALHYYGRLSDDEDREELYRMLQNVTLLSDIRKQILDSIQTHVVDGSEPPEYVDSYPEASEDDDEAFIYAPKRPDKHHKHRPPHFDHSPEIMIHSDLMTDYERNKPHSANLVEIESGHRDCRLRSRRYISDGQCTSPNPITEAVCADSCTMPSYMFNEIPEVDDDVEYLDEPPHRDVQYAGWLRRKTAKRRRARAAPGNTTEKPEKKEKPEKSSDRHDDHHHNHHDYIDDIEIPDFPSKSSTKWSCESGEQAKKRINLLCNDGSLRQYSLKIIVSCRCRKQLYPSYFSGPGPDLDHPASGNHPVKTIIKPVPVPVYSHGPRGKRKYRKRRYKSKRGHHHYHNHKPHRHRRRPKHKHHHHHHHHHHGGHRHHSHGHGKKTNFRGPKPLSKMQWDRIKKKLRKVVKKQRFKTGIRKSFGGQVAAPGSATTEKPGDDSIILGLAG